MGISSDVRVDCRYFLPLALGNLEIFDIVPVLLNHSVKMADETFMGKWAMNSKVFMKKERKDYCPTRTERSFHETGIHRIVRLLKYKKL